jgi:small subunit ribosomal protein S7
MSNRKKWKKSRTIKNKIRVETLYNTYWLRKFLNIIMIRGKKNTAENRLWNLFYYRLKKERYNPKLFSFEAFSKAKWLLTTHLKRFGKHWHSLPTYIPFPRTMNLGISSMVRGARTQRKREEKSFDKRLFDELFSVFWSLDKKSESFKARDEKMDIVLQNKAYLHFRWR